MTATRWCCCGTAVDCCDMQNCATFVKPNSITFTYTGSIVRQYSTGQNCTLATYTYTIESVGAFIEDGTNCDSPNLIPQNRFWCQQARVSYVREDFFWQAKDIQVWCEDDSCGQTNPAWVATCSACTPASNYCECRPVDANFFGLVSKDTYVGNPRIINGITGQGFDSQPPCCMPTPPVGFMQAIAYHCCVVCGCARPTISFTPAGPSPQGCAGTFLSGSDTRTVTTYAFCQNTASVVTDPWVQYMPHMIFSGKCGCPRIDTWANPVHEQDTCKWCLPAPASGPDIVYSTQSTCFPVILCDGLPNGVCETGKVSSISASPASCLYYEECGGSLSAIECPWTVSYQDVVSQQLLVTIT
jgi:hypothetical protein